MSVRVRLGALIFAGRRHSGGQLSAEAGLVATECHNSLKTRRGSLPYFSTGLSDTATSRDAQAAGGWGGVSYVVSSETGLDLITLQRDFRWASVLEVVAGLAPQLIAEGADPYKVDLPVTDFPASAIQPIRSRRALSDEFLTTVAREYLVRGRGYAASLAEEYYVSSRTVVPPAPAVPASPPLPPRATRAARRAAHADHLWVAPAATSACSRHRDHRRRSRHRSAGWFHRCRHPLRRRISLHSCRRRRKWRCRR